MSYSVLTSVHRYPIPIGIKNLVHNISLKITEDRTKPVCIPILSICNNKLFDFTLYFIFWASKMINSYLMKKLTKSKR